MGKALFACFIPGGSRRLVKLVFWGGCTRFVREKQLAAELMIQFPDRLICHADSFYVGLPVPVLAADDELLLGHTYFVLPADRVRCSKTLTAASLTSLSPAPAKVSLAGMGQCPFAYVKGDDGRRLIKVLPEFIARVISIGGEGGRRRSGGDDGGSSICSTPELRKHYAQLVRSRDRPWSPALETISEGRSRSSAKLRLSPVRLSLGRRLI